MTQTNNKQPSNKEQELKDEYENTILKAAAILRKANREGDARRIIEVGIYEILDNWVTDLEAEEAEKQAREEEIRKSNEEIKNLEEEEEYQGMIDRDEI